MPSAPWGRHQKIWPPEGLAKPESKPEESKKKLLTKAEAYALNRADQTELLKSLGAEKIPKLEEDKVALILELQ